MVVAELSKDELISQARAKLDGVENRNQKNLSERFYACLVIEGMPKVEARELGGAIARLEVAKIPLNDILRQMLWRNEEAVRKAGLWQEKLLWVE